MRATYRLTVAASGRKDEVGPDPLNPDRYAPDSPWEESVMTLPDAPPRPWRAVHPRGIWEDFELESAALGGTTRIDVYLPDSWDPATSEDWHVLIGMDGIGYRSPLIPSDRVIEYLIDTDRIPPTLVVLTEDIAFVGDNRGYGPVVDFLADEVLPEIRRRYGLSSDPDRVTISGKSRRGMISAYAAFERPDVIGNVLSLSGSYYWSPPGSTEYEWLPRLFAEAPKKNIELYLSAGIFERSVSVRNAGHYLLATNRHMRDVLAAKGYDFHYEEFPSVHRELNWETLLVHGLTALHLDEMDPVAD
jgi:enterochelin esterase family protein